MTVPTVGRIVHYKLAVDDALAIGVQRQPTYHESRPGLIGPDNHVTKVYDKNGNPASRGDIYPMLITRVWGDTETSHVNGQVFLDGNDCLWVTSVQQALIDDAFDGEPDSLPERYWMFPPRV